MGTTEDKTHQGGDSAIELVELDVLREKSDGSRRYDGVDTTFGVRSRLGELSLAEKMDRGGNEKVCSRLEGVYQIFIDRT